MVIKYVPETIVSGTYPHNPLSLFTIPVSPVQRRRDFKVFILPNLYGDIITDEAAEFQGGVGTAGSANIGKKYAMFEAIHGSAPRMIAEGLGAYANPESILRAEVMMLRHICRQKAAQRLETALNQCDISVTGDASGATCVSYADALLKLL